MHLLGIVLPVFLLIALGVGVRRWLGLDPRPFARLSLYILSPSLSLNAILTAELQASQVGGILAFALAWTAVMVALTMLVSRLLRLGRSGESSLLLSSAFCNTANYGLPVVLFALGQAGFDRAIIFVVYMAVSMATLGVYFAARTTAATGELAAAAGDGVVPTGPPYNGDAGPWPPDGRPVWRIALRRTLRMPLAYAALVGGLLRLVHVSLPEVVMRPLGLLAAATVPLLVIILGLQIGVTLEELGRRRAAARPGGRARSGAAGRGWGLRISLATLLRLVISPLIAYGLARLFALDPLTRTVLVLETGMPIAANINLLAIEFGAEPELTSMATVVTTGLSIVTITVLLAVLI